MAAESMNPAPSEMKVFRAVRRNRGWEETIQPPQMFASEAVRPSRIRTGSRSAMSVARSAA
jgi:hypothetical protein